MGITWVFLSSTQYSQVTLWYCSVSCLLSHIHHSKDFCLIKQQPPRLNKWLSEKERTYKTSLKSLKSLLSLLFLPPTSVLSEGQCQVWNKHGFNFASCKVTPGDKIRKRTLHFCSTWGNTFLRLLTQPHSHYITFHTDPQFFVCFYSHFIIFLYLKVIFYKWKKGGKKTNLCFAVVIMMGLTVLPCRLYWSAVLFEKKVSLNLHIKPFTRIVQLVCPRAFKNPSAWRDMFRR